MKRPFIEFPEFSRLVKDGKLSDQTLKSLQNEIMSHGGAVIPGTGGLRKLRAAGSGRGKSGGARVIYADYPEYAVAVLITAYFKNVKENLTGEESRILAALKRRLDEQIGVRYGKKKR